MSCQVNIHRTCQYSEQAHRSCLRARSTDLEQTRPALARLPQRRGCLERRVSASLRPWNGLLRYSSALADALATPPNSATQCASPHDHGRFRRESSCAPKRSAEMALLSPWCFRGSSALGLCCLALSRWNSTHAMNCTRWSLATCSATRTPHPSRFASFAQCAIVCKGRPTKEPHPIAPTRVGSQLSTRRSESAPLGRQH
jgi:hypothetical protein